MKTAIFCFSEAGAVLSERLCSLLDTDKSGVHAPERLASAYGFTSHSSFSDDIGALFSYNDALVFVGACGIAVRLIAPHIKSKTSDPAVIVIDDRGGYVIPVLSGHIGGANRLAKLIAQKLGALPVITTATDRAGRFSCDGWASQNGCVISSMETAKEISAEILENDVPICSDYPLPAFLPSGLFSQSGGKIGIYIGIHKKEPFDKTLRLIPRTVFLGIGCRRGTSKEDLLSAVNTVLDSCDIDIRAVGLIASIDVKKDEEGLIALAGELNADMVFYTAEELNCAEGDFAESEFVRKTVGTGNVCERAAALAGNNPLIKKTAVGGVTVAAAEKDWSVKF